MSVASVRLSDIVRPFRGDGGQNIEEWLDKVEMVARLQKIGDCKDFVPLFLEGAAYAVYQQFTDTVKASYTQLKAELLGAFAMDKFTAFDAFRVRRLHDGENVDVFLADLRRLMGLVGGVVSDELLLCAFVSGLPSSVSAQLRALSNVDSLPLADLVKKARMLVTDYSSPACAAASSLSSPSFPTPLAKRAFGGYCYTCHRRGHKMQDCPSGNGRGEASLEQVPSPQ